MSPESESVDKLTMATARAGHATDAGAARRGALAVFAAFGAAFVMSQFFRALNGVLAKDLGQEFALSPGGVAFLTACFFIAFGVAQIPIGIMFDRFGPRRSVATALLIAVTGAVLYGAAPSLSVLYLGRILQGAGFAGVLMGSLLVFSRWFTADRYGTWMGRMIALGGAGGLLATAPLAALADAVGWRAACFGGAVLTLGSAALVYTIARDAPPGHPVLARPRESWRGSLKGVRDVIATPWLKPILAMCLVSYPINISLIGLWAPPYLMDVYGLDAKAAGAIVLGMGIALILANLAIGPLERRLDTRKWLSLGCAVVVLVALAILGAVPGLPLALSATLLTIVGGASCYNVVLAGHARSLFPDRLSGRGMAIVAIALMGGPALMQAVSGGLADLFPHEGGRLAEDGYRAVFGFFALSIVASMLTYLPVPDARPSRGFTVRDEAA